MKCIRYKMFTDQKWTIRMYNVLCAKPSVYRTNPILSFVGLSGGEIFHEMMLREGVKHIC